MKKRFFAKTLFFAFFFSFAISLTAQEIVMGTVSDEKGETLIGVSIKVEGDATKGTVTDFDGKFSINVPKNTVLEFSYIGFEPQKHTVTNSKKPLVIIMSENSKFLDEVVVIGYQSVRRRDLTGSVAKADLEGMLKAPVANLDQSLAGRVAGMTVSSSEGTPGATMNIVIRGNNSVTQGNSPLYVIDGFPIEDPSIAASINPNDIQSFDVLKDASATAIYGARGANGVIMITTKQGKAGGMQVHYDGSAGVQWIKKKIDMMDAYEFVKLQAEILPGKALDGNGRYFETYNGKKYTLEDYKNVPQYDWQDRIFEQAWQQNHNLSLNGGTPEARYTASLSYTDQDGIVMNSNYNKIQGRLRLNIRKGKFTASATTNYSRDVTTGGVPSQNSSSGMNALFYSVWGYRPVTQPSTPLDYLLNNITDQSEGINSSNDYRFNPIMSLDNEYRKNYNTNFQVNGFGEYEFLPDMRFKVMGGYTANDKRDESFNGSKTRYGYPGSANGINARLVTQERRTWINENTVTYRKKINKIHNINGVAGVTLQQQNFKYNSHQAINLPSDLIGMNGIKQGTPGAMDSRQETWSLFSYLGRINYDYASKYYITASFRADGSSKFASGNRWGYFPSTGVAWNFMDESFMKPLSKVLSSGKIRAGWGQTGNNNIRPYEYLATIDYRREAQGNMTGMGDIPHSIYPNSKGPIIGSMPMNIPNADLKWETTQQSNIGIDLSLFKERINLTVDVYDKLTRDLLSYVRVPPSVGFGQVMRNIGKVQNRGIEFTLNTVNVTTKDFTWTSDFNIAFNKNKIKQLAENGASLLSNAPFDQSFNAMSNYMGKVGNPIGMMYGYKYEGTYKLDEFDQIGSKYVLKPGIANFSTEMDTQPGFPKYADLNGDGVIDSNDQTIIGRGEPIHVGGFANNFQYKGFDLNIFFQWSYGNDILNANRLMFESGFNKKRELNQFASYAKRWTFENPNSNIPRVAVSSSNMVFSSRVIEDGSYLRLKTIALGYTLPAKLTKSWHLAKVRVHASAQNLLTFTSYSGYDPEVSVRNSALTPGLDFSAYPRAATFNFGVNIDF